MLGLKVGFITLHTEERKFIANKKFAINFIEAKPLKRLKVPSGKPTSRRVSLL